MVKNGLPPTRKSGTSGPNLFADPVAAFAAFTFTLPGESGDRNAIRVPALKVMNLGVSKEFKLFTLHDVQHKLQFRWETYNLTNTAILSAPSVSVGSQSTFGKFTSQLGTPRQMQFALRYSF